MVLVNIHVNTHIGSGDNETSLVLRALSLFLRIVVVTPVLESRWLFARRNYLPAVLSSYAIAITTLVLYVRKVRVALLSQHRQRAKKP